VGIVASDSKSHTAGGGKRRVSAERLAVDSGASRGCHYDAVSLLPCGTPGSAR
jgi:hypothetical protein